MSFIGDTESHQTPASHSQFENTPLPVADHISAGVDYYKPTMSQLAYEQEPDVEVTFTFHNRGTDRLLDYVNPAALQRRFHELQVRGWSRQELNYLRTLRTSEGHAVFTDAYLAYLQVHTLPDIKVLHAKNSDDLGFETTGPWALATFWETIVMSEVSEAYFEGYLQARGIDPFVVYDEGDRRLSEKIAVLQAHPDIKFADFGTRRRFSLRWQKHVMERLLAECPGNIIGTSNVALAENLGMKPIGTFAHELPMVYAGLADARQENVRVSHGRLLEDWFARYGADYSIALTDTFGTDFFFSDFTPKQSAAWRGVRHDSGNPFAFGERLISFYVANGIDPTAKTVVFSDGLDIDSIVALQQHFSGRINTLYGWGTTLTNDLGIQPLNIVMKATHVRVTEDCQEADTVKLSDIPGKHTGPADLVRAYQERYFAVHEA